MISKERYEELEAYFWEESNDPETEEWRETLTEEEEKLIDQWDENVAIGTRNLAKAILKNWDEE